MHVQAKEVGYIHNIRKRPGDVFELKAIKGLKIDPFTGEETGTVISPEQQFSPKWMKKLEDEEVTKAKSKGKVKTSDVREAIAMSKVDVKQVLPAEEDGI